MVPVPMNQPMTGNSSATPNRIQKIWAMTGLSLFIGRPLQGLIQFSSRVEPHWFRSVSATHALATHALATHACRRGGLDGLDGRFGCRLLFFRRCRPGFLPLFV